jgi:hypothetical protein
MVVDMATEASAAPLGSLGILAIPSKPTDTNIAFFPIRPDEIEEGPLAWVGTGPNRRPDPARPLLYALLGPGATPLGLADLFIALVSPHLSLGTGVPTREEAAAMLLDLNGWTTDSQLASDWSAGTLVKLPIQYTVGPPANWAVELPSPMPTVSPPDARLFAVATNLDGAGPRRAPGDRGLEPLRQLVQQELISYVGPQATLPLPSLGQALARRTLRNPYESLFTTVEMLAQLPVGSGTTRPTEDFIAAFVAELGTPQLEVIASTSGGQAILRQFFRAVPAGALRTRIGDALQQPKDGAGAFRTLDAARPGRIAREPPLCKELQSVVQTEGSQKGKSILFAMTLGRRVSVFEPTDTPYDNADWTGPSHVGETLPETYFATHRATMPTPTGSLTAARARERWEARMRVALPLAINEGWLEGMRMADKAFASIGLQQWSFHVNEEGTVLLERFRARNRMLFDVFFGMAGLETAVCDATGDPSASLARLAADNPDAYEQVPEDPQNPSSSLVWVKTDGKERVQDYYPAHVTLRGAASGEEHQILPASNMALRAADRGRFRFFGFNVVREPTYNANGTIKSKGSFKVGSDNLGWAGRFRLALQTVPEWIPLQFQQADYRFTQFQRRIRLDIGSQLAAGGGFQEIPVWCGHGHDVTELLSSEFSAALAVDIFINGTGLASDVVREAWRRTQAAYTAEGIAPADLHEAVSPPLKPRLKREVLFRFSLELAGVRRAYGFDPDTRMARAAGMHDRQSNEVYRPSSGDFKSGRTRQVKFDLLSAPLSFKGWD